MLLSIDLLAAKSAKKQPPRTRRTARAKPKAQRRVNSRRLFRSVWRRHVRAKLEEDNERGYSPQGDKKRQESHAPPLLGEQEVKRCK